MYLARSQSRLLDINFEMDEVNEDEVEEVVEMLVARLST